VRVSLIPEGKDDDKRSLLVVCRSSSVVHRKMLQGGFDPLYMPLIAR
jgi:hypothetical protein